MDELTHEVLSAARSDNPADRMTDQPIGQMEPPAGRRSTSAAILRLDPRRSSGPWPTAGWHEPDVGGLDATTARQDSVRHRLDGLSLPEFFLVVGRSVKVECKLAAEPELRRGTESLRQP